MQGADRKPELTFWTYGLKSGEEKGINKYKLYRLCTTAPMCLNNSERFLMCDAVHI